MGFIQEAQVMARGRYSKRDAQGFHQFDYFGVTPEVFTRALQTGRYQGKKISRKGSYTLVSLSGFRHFTLARRIPKSKRYVR